ncbi:uncharacterized protein PG998_006923 [Apiospora kogelbergensis]|uniref:uncharacterized protein n=1 Tax=Apiospora kogelbergensis TaxID=1337665 RepID=UPI0031300BA6
MTLDDDKDQDQPADPTTPHATSKSKGPAPGSAGATPKSAPAAGGTRPRSATTKQQPTLLTDFLLGRPSPARVAADREAARQRRMTLEQVKQEMRAEVVRKVQAPGGVHDRVKLWQKKNAAAMENADPLAAPSEPSDIALQVDEQSVTEADRMRIKKGEKRKSATKPVIVVEHGNDGDETEKENHGSSSVGCPPKKRVVSDTNWMKNRKRSPSRKASPKPKADLGKGSPLPKDFLTRSTPNPAVKNKIKAWAEKVEIPDEPRIKRYSVSRSVGSGDGIRVRSMMSGDDDASERTEDPEIVVEQHRRHRKTKSAHDDGIRVTPAKKPTSQDDGIRIRPQKPILRDDGIRVYSSERGTSEGASTVRAPSSHRSRGPSTRASSSRREASSARREPSSERIEVIEDAESEVPNTPTRRSSGKKSTKLPGKSAARSHADTGTTITEDYSDEDSWSSGSEDSAEDSRVDSDVPSSLPSKLAEIPVGYSAFSELNLPASGQPKRPKPAKRNPSFKGATNVLKQALTQGKKIITEKVDPPPKPVANQPRSIESWLNKTVDPFVEATKSTTTSTTAPSSIPETKRNSLEKVPTNESHTRRSTSTYKRKPADKPAAETRSLAETESELTGLTSSTAEDTNTTLTRETATTASEETETVLSEETASIDAPTSVPSSSGLRRSRATRSPSSPISKPASRKGFKDLFKEAFRGESAAPKPIPTTYPSCSEEIEIDDHQFDESEHPRKTSGSRTNLSYLDDESSYLTGSSRSYLTESSRSASTATYPKRRPPTKGIHELSTILSEKTGNTGGSDLSSMLSDSTVTQTNTAFTGGTESNISRSNLSRHRSNRSGLKRRLTKHSDLVSVLSLPDEKPRPGRSSSLKSRRSVRRPTSHPSSATVDALLQEFARDEDLYLRELKTLVDGVIPVLLTQVAQGNDPSHADLFASSSSGKEKVDSSAKSVIQMGIALEKLRNSHKRCPMHDAHRLPQWLDSVYSIYDQYLDAWRLGFEDLIVNLAPRSPDDEDSLINALPRNEQGDVLNEDGERVDVAHLLKKPLIRVKYISKFIKGYRQTTGTERYQEHEKFWEKLEGKVRRRHKEESARIVDEDAINTDVTRVRDLGTLEALDNVRIDRFRQVYAKDSFALDLRHTNGQRLDCQVELISRDNQLFKSDPGDILIRETGSRGRTWLLFAPVSGGYCSARKGDAPGELVVMIRGNRDEWYQVITLTTDNDEQVEEWLDILGTNPVPPAVFKAEAAGPESLILIPQATRGDTPLGETKQRRVSSIHAPIRSDSSPDVKTTTPPRYHSRTGSAPTTPTSPSRRSPSLEKTPTQDSYSRSHHRSASSPKLREDRSHPLREEMRPDDLVITEKSDSNRPSRREDCPPPPPAHRTPLSQKTPALPPPEPTSNKIKRRGSSPLKHEYHPSDISSQGSESATESEEEDDDESSDYESSDDELEAADMPDTTPAISIKPQDESPSDSTGEDNLPSLTPSASASQAGLSQLGGKTPSYVYQSAASISYWDNKRGCWKDLWPDTCSIITTPGLIEAYPIRGDTAPREDERPLIALDLTPMVMLRNSTVVDLEIRSPVLSYARLYMKVMKVESTFFRFRTASYNDCEALYMSVHKARMDNAKYKALEEEARVRAFGQNQAAMAVDDDGSSRRRSWFGRKNSYRASTRAPSQSGGSASLHSSVSASSFLKRLMGAGNTSFDIGMSSIDKQNHRHSADPSLYTSSSGSGTPPRSPSISAAQSGNAKRSLTTNNLKIRLHLMVSASKWEDHGNCTLEVTRPDQGTRQNLKKYQGLEKRIIVTSIPKKSSKDETPTVLLDVVLGSRCFTRLGSRGILLNVWEELLNKKGEATVADKGGTNIGQVNKWCFQCASVTEAGWIYGLVTQEVVIS